MTQGSDIQQAVTKQSQDREALRDLMRRYFDEHHKLQPFIAGKTPIPYARRNYGAEEGIAALEAVLDFTLTLGRFGHRFERDLAKRLGAHGVALANSGSSANLLAVSALTSPKLERPLKAGDEVITVAAGFPTTVAPIYQNNLTPVYVDIDPDTLAPPKGALEAAVGPKSRAVFMAHTLGNPFDIDEALAVTRAKNLHLLEDCCDALGSTYKGKSVGSFGSLATVSFFPAHHITMGEGGAVAYSDANLGKIVRSFRDWGRDCWCDAGKDNTCGKRFGQQFGALPFGYDHKYVYTHVGYNLKPTDLQAAIGCAQLERLDGFCAARRANHAHLLKHLSRYAEFLHLPRATEGSDPSWFAFVAVVRDGAPFTRDEIVRWLEERKVQTRMIFGGDITMQPAFQGLPRRVSGELKGTRVVMEGGFFVGVHPGLTAEMLDYMTDTFDGFFKSKGLAR